MSQVRASWSLIQPICGKSSPSRVTTSAALQSKSSANSSQQVESKSRHKISGRRCSYLALDVHDDHSAGPVTHHKVLRVLGYQNHVVNRNVRSFWNIRSFDGNGAFCRVYVPDLRSRGSVLMPQRRGEERGGEGCNGPSGSVCKCNADSPSPCHLLRR